MKFRFFIISFIFLTLLINIFVFAGITSNTSTPTATMYTLEDIYNLIHNNTIATEGNHSLSPDSEPTATSSYSTAQIYADLANLIKRENLVTGAPYLGVTGQYGVSDPDYATTTFTASSLTSSGTAGEATGYSLEDIWGLISSGTRVTEASHASSTWLYYRSPNWF